MYDPNNPIFQVTDPNHGKSETEILMDRVRQAQLKNMESQLNKAEQLQAKVDRPQQAQRNLAPIMALADTIAPGKNLLQTYMATKPKDPRLKDEALLRQYQQNAASSANALASGVYQSGGLGRQKEMADYNHQLAMERIRENKLNKKEEAASKPVKYNKDERDAAGFSKRLAQAQNIFSELEAEGYDRTSAGEGASSMLFNAWKGKNLKRQEQAERNFVNAQLRRESGAAISPAEFESAEVQYFPRVGDGPEVLAQKRRNREQAILNMEFSSGGAAEKLDSAPMVTPKKTKKLQLKSPKAQNLAKEFGF